MAETKKRFEALTGGRIFEGYALTESGMAAVCNPLVGENKLGSVGMPLPDVELEIVDARERRQQVLPAGEVGEIILRAPNLMKGYWKNATETAAMLRAHGAGKPWLFTGDLGYLDEDGYLFIVDRKKDLIKASGFQVWPRDVEEAVAKHPAVAEVGVVGVPDPEKGEVVAAFVVLRPGMTRDRGGVARLLQGAPRAVQGADEDRVPRRSAEVDGRQGAAPHAPGAGGRRARPGLAH